MAVRDVRMELVGGNRNAAEFVEPTGGISSYFIGRTEKDWHTGIPHYTRVRYRNVYSGIDLVYYGSGRDIEYDFVLRPGADPNQIRVAYNKPVRVDENGALCAKSFQRSDFDKTPPASSIATMKASDPLPRHTVREWSRVGQAQQAIEEYSNYMRMPIVAILLACVVGAQPGAKPGGKKVNPKDGLTYVWIPPGSFTMGCSTRDLECHDAEKPAHRVTLTRGYWLGQTAVTVGAYKRYAHASGKAMPPEPRFIDRDLNPGWREEQQPIVNVTWDEAGAYCAASAGRLPTEAEFEYAARAGTNGPRYGTAGEIAWYADNSGDRLIDAAKIRREDEANFGRRINENKDRLRPVGQKQPNAFNLYDMLGNVYEWTADWHTDYAAAPTSDPHGPPTGKFRVVRGGNWNSDIRDLRVSVREWFIPSLRNLGIGFRCAGS